jgi:hypothetical protein
MARNSAKSWSFIVFLLALLSLPGIAQRPLSKGEKDGRGRPGATSMNEANSSFVASLKRFSGKTVKGAPFTATVETTYIQTLGDGTKITRQSTATIARDSEGRTRREQTLGGLGPLAADAATGEAPKFVFIHDPVLDLEYVVDMQRRTVNKKSFAHHAPPPVAELPKNANAKQESLGKQLIEGIEAEGKRSVITIPAGQIGNDRVVEIVSEQWYAPALQEIILSKHRDPRLGENTYRLTNINRREPDATLFHPPADFTSTGSPFRKDGKRGRGRHLDDE